MKKVLANKDNSKRDIDEYVAMTSPFCQPEGNIWRLGESISVLCDSITSIEYDRVMPLFGDGSIRIWRAIDKNTHGTVLDLGTGSGVLALEAAKYADKVIGIDINSKAIRYARAGAVLNNVTAKCDFREGNLYEPVQGEKFDLIICNPPFMPEPQSFKLFLSVDGGPDGMEVVKKVIEQAPGYLTAEGRAIFLSMSLGDKREPIVYKYLREAFQKRAVSIKTRHLLRDIRSGAEPLFDLFKKFPGFSDWIDQLHEQGLTYIYHMLHEIEPAAIFSHSESHEFDPRSENVYSGSLNGRIRRYKLWIDKVYGESDTRVSKLHSDAAI